MDIEKILTVGEAIEGDKVRTVTVQKKFCLSNIRRVVGRRLYASALFRQRA